MTHCGICGRELNQPKVPETMNRGGDCAACMAGFGDRECIEFLKDLCDPEKRPAEIAKYEAWRVKQI